MFDSHTHICSPVLRKESKQTLKRFKDIGGQGLLNVAYDLDTIFLVIEQTEEIRERYKIEALTAIGLHPELYYSGSQHDDRIRNLEEATKTIKILTNQLERHIEKISALGETGLDYSMIIKDKELTLDQKEEQIQLQKHSFRAHLQLARKYDLPLTIHLRDIEGSDQVVKDALSLISEVGEGFIRGVFHSYTGPEKYLDQITSLGFMIGFNGIITYKSGENVRNLVKYLDKEYILIETDAPYLPPNEKRKRGKKSGIKYGEPADLPEIISTIGDIKGLTDKKVVQITSENFLSMFKSR